jgi:hypothetical protein
VANGLILLSFIAVLFVLGISRLRRRIGAPATGRAMAATFAGFMIAVLILWAAGR